MQTKSTQGKCRLCGHDRLSPLLEEKVMTFRPECDGAVAARVNYEGCPRCGFIQVEPLPAPDFLKNYYRAAPVASLDHQVLHAVKDSYFDSTLTFLERFLPTPPERIFETGAASAYLLHLLAERFRAEVAGLEPSEECRRWALQEFGIPLYGGMLEDLDLEAQGLREAFDLNVCCSVAEHAPWPGELMARMAETVKAGGHIYVEVPSLRPPATGPLVEKVVHPLHLGYFSPQALIHLGSQAGLTILHLEEVGGLEVPVYRAMYVKEAPLEHVRNLFDRHLEHFNRKQETILAACQRYVAGADNVWIWGISNNFFSLWCQNAQVFVPEKCRLVDKNPAKIGKRLGSLVVSPPDQAVCGHPQVILVATTSRLIQENIINEAKRRFPETEIHSLFESEMSHAAQ
ncbi:MAG: methyltransferase domain-containing protein [Thermodesulfobacteriota bacterium]